MTDRQTLSSRLGRLGVWSFQLDAMTSAQARDAVCGIEELGFGAIWIPEGYGSKEAYSHAATLLSATGTLVVATGIANIWARDPMAMANGGKVLAEAYPNRFLLGIGVSHAVRAEARGHTYDRPFSRTRDYLAAMDAAPGPDLPPPPRVLAALGPKMLALSAEAAMGAHPYFVPVEHTRIAREAIGPDKFLAPEQLVVLESDPGTARAIGREFISHYMGLPNYANNLLRLGWDVEDTAEPYSDRFVDALVAWGDVERVGTRIREHLDAGADHVALQVLRADASEFPVEELRELAAALVEG